MDGRELQEEDGCFRESPKFPVWIIEHIWAHKLMDIQEVIDTSRWPDVDSQPLSLEDSWRLRVVSAQVYSIVRSRDMTNYERVMGFLDTTYRLLPRLVRAIKHMKIMFGLKTTVIIWMLKEGKGMVDIVSKIGQFFPNKLPQYQDQCSQHEMFLMRKNHINFKSFAQTLAMKKDRLEEYMKNQMEEEYGERYAQKVEDRLLHYLHELESALPGDTYIDKILKKHSPVSEEEKLLLDIITSDSTTIAATLRKLLHCDVAICHPVGIFQSPEAEVSQLSRSSLHGSPTESEGQIQSEVFRDPSEQIPLLLENESSTDVREDQQPEDEAVRTVEGRRNEKEEELGQRGRGGGKEVSSSPQFCSRHQRWVKNILRSCLDDCSEELLHQTHVSLSPVLFQSSSSTSSSQDLTPSDLVPSPTHQPPSQTSTNAQASKTTNTGDNRSSASPETMSDPSQRESLLQPTSTKIPSLPTLLSPVVRLVDIASFWRRHQCISSSRVTFLITKQGSSTPQAPSHHCESENRDSMLFLPETHPNVQTASVTPDVSAQTSRQRPTRKTLSKLSQKFRRASSTSRHSQDSTNTSAAEQFAMNQATFPMSCTTAAESPRQVVHQNSDKPHPETHNTKPASCLPVSSSDPLQPYVRLTRLSAQECRRATDGRASTGQEEAVEQSSCDDERTKETQENPDSSFDVNTLYSSGSSSSNWEDWTDPDPDYRPHIKKKRLLLEYESLRIQNHT